MSRQSSQQLFRLIKSMTPAEKRYFKMLYSKSGSNDNRKFIKLFELIDKQEIYDEAKILSHDKTIKKEQISNMKAHLYDLLLKSLVNYNPDKDIEVVLRNMLNRTNILYNKSLYEQAWQILKKAEKLAIKFDKILLLYEIKEFQKKVLTKLIHYDIEYDINKIISDSEKLIDAIKSTRNFRNLALKLYAFYLRIGFIRNTKDFERASNFLYSSLPAFNEEELTFNEKMFLYQAFVGYYLFIQDPVRAYEYSKKLIALFDSRPDLIIPKAEYYIKALNNLIASQYRLFLFDEYVKTCERFHNVKEIQGLNLTFNQKILLFKYSSIHKLNYYFMTGDFASGVKIIPDIASELETYQDKLDIHTTMLFYYKFASMYFGDDQYKETIFWLNKIINSKDLNIRSDIQGFARILNLISHWELKNTVLVDYYIRSTQRFLEKKQDFHLYQKYMIKFLQKLNNATPDNITDAFKELYEHLKPLESNPYEKRAFAYFDILSWLESKIENKPVSQIIKEKANKKLERIHRQRI